MNLEHLDYEQNAFADIFAWLRSSELNMSQPIANADNHNAKVIFRF